MPHWTLHDIRRTVVTNLGESREDAEGTSVYSFAQPHIVEAIVNHVSGQAKKGVAGTYNKAVYLAEKREALAKWGAHIARLVSQPAKLAKPQQSASRDASVIAAKGDAIVAAAKASGQNLTAGPIGTMRKIMRCLDANDGCGREMGDYLIEEVGLKRSLGSKNDAARYAKLK